MAGILIVKPVSQARISQELSGHVSKSEKESFSSPPYTLKNHELAVAMLIKTGSNNIVLHLLFTNVNNIVQHCCTPFKMNNIAQCCYINCKKIVQHNIVATCCTGSTVQYSRLSVFGRAEPTLLYDRKQRPKMEISNSSRFIVACKLLAIPNTNGRELPSTL